MTQSPVRGQTAFRSSWLTGLLFIFLLGATFIWYSVKTHPAIHSRVAVLNTRRSMNVLVSVQGTPLNPGFVGFIAEVRPHTEVLKAVPVSGTVEVTAPGSHRREPLYQAVSALTAKQAANLVSHTEHMRIDRYFYLTPESLFALVNALYYHSNHWPVQRTPLTMLETLGYPGRRIDPKREMGLVRSMVNHLQDVNPLAAASLLTIPNTAVTNLSREELFELANYVHGDRIVTAYPPRSHSHRRVHHG